MPPRLPFFSAAKAPSAFISRIARPFSSTPAVAQSSSDPISNLLNLDEKPQVHSADRIRGIINKGGKARMEGAAARKRTMLESLREKKVSDDYVKQMPRRWRAGEVYAPHDLSPVEMEKWRKSKRPNIDVIDLLGINPLDHYRNFSMISEYMTSFGQIEHSKNTGLRPVNQRRIAKAIRRAIGMGIHPSVHHHPELLRKRFRLNASWK
ncbi:ribosomal protein S18 [Colletotrichum tofieldiae]|uniref:Small ribosomal subunit protein bS18m n=1 Tax=Colletotrichum tofieldiae TaxID=708197 RepID=A0A166TMT4_9PEZI|nr:ribosomal protein S18 [Colletotrichum tofieldiae]GKT60311.1 ribosomal protein S18 [Colletotrichum tofieldiae]GKT68022.1 ribosomal protein S18 [Colletotrichum tofieldiae]GKT90995.1 ribosomal protein S18 [Colletotrichum tofieldiae]